MNPVIKVSNLSKSYKISHQSELKKAGYSTLKDDFTSLMKRPFNKEERDTQETFWALKHINFEINRGEAFGVIGKNGSGKSTLLKILSRIVDPSTGTVEMHGKVASLLEVGTGFHAELTGRENVYFNGSMIGMSKKEIDRKFDEIVAFSEVEKFLDTPVKFYSSGMYVRLAFSVAAHLESEILIIDEVLSVGDAGFQKKSLDKMMSIAKEGRTILFVSHSMASVEQLCDRALLLDGGEIKLIGETDEVAEAYLDENITSNLGVAERIDRSERVDEAYGKSVIIKAVACSGNRKKFFFNEDMSFMINVNRKEEIKDDIFLGIGITDPEGKRIFTFESPNNLLLKKGDNEIICVILAPKLQAGLYSIDLGIRTTTETLDFIPQTLSFKIDSRDKDGISHHPVYEPATSGYIVPEANVKVRNRK